MITRATSAYRFLAAGLTSVGTMLGVAASSAQELATERLELVRATAERFSRDSCLRVLLYADILFRNAQSQGLAYNPEFPQDLANFISPRGGQTMRNLLVSGVLSRILGSVDPADQQRRDIILNLATCDGRTDIRVNEVGDAMLNQLMEELMKREPPINLRAAGVHSVRIDTPTPINPFTLTP